MAKKVRKTKTRMSGVTDHSSMGLTTYDNIDASPGYNAKSSHFNTEMEITQTSYQQIKRALKAFINNTAEDATTRFSMNADSNSNVFYLNFKNLDESDNTIVYEFKTAGKKRFLNVSGNPSCMIAGSNDIPALVVGSVFEKERAFNGPTITFKYMNRVMYSILDNLLEPYGFVWSGIDKQNLVEGNISITSYQIAWYSANLGDVRSRVMRFIRLMYGGLLKTADRTENLAKSLNVATRIHDNNPGNITLEAKSGNNIYFTLTLYSKDEDPNYIRVDDERTNRVSQLIRWDCTLRNAFLANKGIKTIKKLEERYITECEASSYDAGFVKWISKEIRKKLKFDYILGMNSVTYAKGLTALESVNTKYEQLLADHWLQRNEPFKSNVEALKHFNLPQSAEPRISIAKKNLLERGIDIEISRAFHTAMLKQRAEGTLTEEEHDANYFETNRAVRMSEMKERDLVASLEVKTALASGAVSSIRRFAPIKVNVGKFHILKGVAQKER